MYPDFLELLSAFDAESVKYLIIGGYAVSQHAQPRATKDLDLLISPDPENAAAVFRALAKFGAPLQGLTAADLAAPGGFFRMGAPPRMIDILPEIKGVTFDEAWQHRVVGVIDPDSGQVGAFISASNLIKAKIASGRPQDLADVTAIRAAQDKPKG